MRRPKATTGGQAPAGTTARTWVLGLLLVAFGAAVLAWGASPLKAGLRDALRRELVDMDSPIRGTADVIYVLGGGVRSTRSHLKRAAALYHQGVSKKILYFHRDGDTVRDWGLGRVISRDAWVVRQLVDLGVPVSDTEAVPVMEGFWGTYSEAEAVALLLAKRNQKSLVLVTSPHHTKRVRQSFAYFFQGQGVSILVGGSDDKAYLRELLMEHVKLRVYSLLLLRG
ncbi:YdcF family protein [Desulfoluna spongiiphila]|uniref:YdcF family protein n=1 Tax=Desulfoluna spongiiphila TaxID=419481 RepID=UPI00125F965F|nr:YdcF family protein [Desulfoluna spongiiphila]